MKNNITFLILLFISIYSMNCKTYDSSRGAVTDIEVKQDNCLRLDSLVANFNYETSGNFIVNEIVPKLEESSGLNSNCNKGFLGYMYESKEQFERDILMWKKHFKCK